MTSHQRLGLFLQGVTSGLSAVSFAMGGFVLGSRWQSEPWWAGLFLFLNGVAVGGVAWKTAYHRGKFDMQRELASRDRAAVP